MSPNVRQRIMEYNNELIRLDPEYKVVLTHHRGIPTAQQIITLSDNSKVVVREDNRTCPGPGDGSPCKYGKTVDKTTGTQNNQDSDRRQAD